MNLYVENVLSTKIYNRAYNKGRAAEEVFVDPATLILIGKISVTVIRLIKGCKKSREERQEVVIAPTINENRILKRVVRRHLGWFKYMTMGGKVLTAIKEVGCELNEDELEQADLFNDNDNFTVYDGEKYYEL
tara:strand:- start:834 stop:1232 length:399 start_codon:yes stop_codon:yes gene_type:complete